MTIDPSPASRHATARRVGKLCFWLLLSLFLFVLGLELIKSGAGALVSWFSPQGMTSLRGAFGAGWILACIVLSGSPVAAISLGLLDSGQIDDPASFAMINGSRVGASFVVLVVGYLYDWRAKGERGGVYVGALALITTATVYFPAFILGYFLFMAGWMEGVHMQLPGTLRSVIDLTVDPCVRLVGFLPAGLKSLLGVAVLVSAFKLFDGFLPVADPTGGRIRNMATTIYRPWIAFLFGMIVTSVTLSVSVSLSLLVPLTVRGMVRRENLIPFIMGANITTFIDTLFASMLLENPAGFRVVCGSITAVTVVTLPILFLAYRPYERLVDNLARKVTRDRRRLTLFVCALFLVPLLLILMQ